MVMMLNRRGVIGAAGVGLGLMLRPAWAEAIPTGATECIAKTAEGKLRGVRANGLDVYKGVPYAGDVTGTGRFKAAPPLKPWSGIRDAIRLGAPAIQPAGGTYGIDEPAPDENCLFLNIWAPTGGARGKPVMVYSHGGGWVGGSGGSVLADGGNLARENDVVVVATNHRLGVMGFLYLDELGGAEYAGSGNRCIEDIAAALKWISRNIEEFGGDPHNVMIFGESGGAGKTCCLNAAPAAKNFFNKASIDSGPVAAVMKPETAAETTNLLLADLGIDRKDWRQLIDVPAGKLLEAQMRLGSSPNVRPEAWTGPIGAWAGKAGEFGAVHDGHILPHHPFEPQAPSFSRDKPLIVGGNADEQHFFSLVTGDVAAWSLDETMLAERMRTTLGSEAEKALAAYRADRPGATPSELYFAVHSDLFAIQGSTLIAERKVEQGGAAAYRYIFAYRSENPIPGSDAKIGAMHGLDIAIKFNNVDAKLRGQPFAGTRPERVAAGQNMSRMWANFARTGKPSAEGQPEWPTYDLMNRATMFIDSECHVENDPHPSERRYWKQRR